MALSSSTTTGNLKTLEAVVEIKSSADKVYSLISIEHHNVPKASSDKVHDVAVHEGDWETTGSIKLWKYTIDGTVETLKEKVEIDEANKRVSLTALEGHVLNKYRSIKIIYQVIPKSNEGADHLVKVTLEYEKLNESDQPPNNYLSFCVNVIKDIDAHLIAS
ncbi:PREDICTED: MLP-like protein 43 [Fragaria vesca subsp. vesca]|uniref:MLP-like protein 43 n=1 Tax=Fragaria vesca subsp. vesca TaxID=101020 RepID=UPI0002C2FF60|nr:PREDICTED: MLP-like protein 43 [Fragaria vesca subsp. vesca]